MKKQMVDWRGNIFPEEKLWYTTEKGIKVPLSCELCLENQAVRNCCEAEGDIGRTHWHGAVHIKGGGMKHLCRKCAEIENKKWKD